MNEWKTHFFLSLTRISPFSFYQMLNENIQNLFQFNEHCRFSNFVSHYNTIWWWLDVLFVKLKSKGEKCVLGATSTAKATTTKLIWKKKHTQQWQQRKLRNNLYNSCLSLGRRVVSLYALSVRVCVTTMKTIGNPCIGGKIKVGFWLYQSSTMRRYKKRKKKRNCFYCISIYIRALYIIYEYIEVEK